MTLPANFNRLCRLSISAAVVAAFAGLAGGAAASGARTFTLSSPDLASGTFDKKFTLNGFG